MLQSSISRKGFSLIELLVTISIIGVVSTLGISSAAILQKNSRDTQRKADLRLIQSALQQYYADNNFYPDGLSLTSGSLFDNCTGYTPTGGCSFTPRKTYIQSLPKDPVSGTSTPYCYISRKSVSDATVCSGSNTGKCHSYVLCATMENAGETVSCSCSSIGSVSGNFKITPL